MYRFPEIGLTNLATEKLNQKPNQKLENHLNNWSLLNLLQLWFINSLSKISVNKNWGL